MKDLQIHKNYQRIVKNVSHIIVAIFAFAIIVQIYGLIISPKYDFFNASAYEYYSEWTWEKADGSTEAFSLPIKLPVQKGETVRISTVLPDQIVEGTYFCFLSGRSIKAYIDGELRFEFDNSPGDRLGFTVKGIFLPIPIGPEDAGKTITIVRPDKNAINGNINLVLVGDKHSIMQYIRKLYFTQVMMAAVLAVLSGITFVVSGIISLLQKRLLPLVHLSAGVLACSMWVIYDSYLFQFVTEKYYIDGVAGYMLTLFLVAPFCLYMDQIQDGRYAKLYLLAEIFTIINFVVVSVLHFGHLVPYETALFYIDISMAVVILMILVLGIYDIHFQRNVPQRNYYVSIGLGFLILCAICEIIGINTSINRNYQFGGLFVILGLYVLLVCAIFDQILRLRVVYQRTQEAIASTKAKSDFLANMSHEIRTPINAIIGMNEMILRESQDESVRGYARDVYAASNNLLEIVNDILDFSKIESGKMEIEAENYNLGEVISSVASMIELKARQKNLKFRVEAFEELPSVLCGDSKRVTEIMLNILNNAIKYTHRGFVVFNVSYKKIDNKKILLEFYVRDTGIGIKEEDIDKLFGNFERLEYKRNRSIEGSGLGLAITSKLVDMMGGTIGVESLYGSGSRFTVSIPQEIVDNTPLGDYIAHKHASLTSDEKDWKSFTAPEGRVLVVDDNSMNRTVISKLLIKTKLQVDTIDSGYEMLRVITQNKYDVILLDHMMPEMDGIETLEAAKKLTDNLCADTPVIALTANAIVGAKEKYLEAGFDDYISKPVNPTELEILLVKYLPEDKVIRG